MISEFISRVFWARDVAHFAHLTSSSYAQHMALGSFYDDVVGAADGVTEAYIGQFDEMPEFCRVPDKKMPKDLCKFFREESDWIEENRSEIAGSSPAIENMVDTVTSLYLSLVYKLEHLK